MKHRITIFYMSEPLGDITNVMDELSADGYEVFHLHEAILDGKAAFMIFSRKDTSGQ